MSIHVSEPGRPLGSRLPERFRTRPVVSPGEAEAMPKTGNNQDRPIDPARFQEPGNGNARRALEGYRDDSQDERPGTEQPYLPAGQLTSNRIVTLGAEKSLLDALNAMEEHHIHHLVITSDNQLAGMVDRQWLLWQLWKSAEASSGRPGKGMDLSLADRELPAFITVSVETDAHELARQMLAHNLMAALVLDAMNRPAGIVTTSDYLRLYAEVRQFHTEI
ncbi:MAG: CBS domain-containing protein [Halomonadaceae bacterium]|nr:MAG: CBS domain-containing protein [Halomonadaceae bacterium]